MRKTVVRMIDIDKKGQPCVSPEFLDNAVYLHPVPPKLAHKVARGECWRGVFGRVWDTKRADKQRRPIYVEYFIPQTISSINMALKEI